MLIPSSFLGLLQSENDLIRVFCALIIVTYFVVFLMKYNYWQEKDPDRLQSEWLMVEKMKATMAIKGDRPRVIQDSDLVSPPKYLTETKNDE